MLGYDSAFVKHVLCSEGDVLRQRRFQVRIPTVVKIKVFVFVEKHGHLALGHRLPSFDLHDLLLVFGRVDKGCQHNVLGGQLLFGKLGPQLQIFGDFRVFKKRLRFSRVGVPADKHLPLGRSGVGGFERAVVLDLFRRQIRFPERHGIGLDVEFGVNRRVLLYGLGKVEFLCQGLVLVPPYKVVADLVGSYGGTDGALVFKHRLSRDFRTRKAHGKLLCLSARHERQTHCQSQQHRQKQLCSFHFSFSSVFCFLAYFQILYL